MLGKILDILPIHGIGEFLFVEGQQYLTVLKNLKQLLYTFFRICLSSNCTVRLCATCIRVIWEAFRLG